MSHFGRSGPPDIRDTYSLLVLNITFRTTADDLFPLFDRYGKVVDVFIPRDRRTGESRGFAFVRYKYADEAQKAVEKLDGRVVDGREIMVQFAKYGPNAERIHKGRIIESESKLGSRSRSRSPRPSCKVQSSALLVNMQQLIEINFRHRDENRDRDRDRDRDRRRSRSRSRDRYDRDRSHKSEREHRYRSRSRSASPDRHKGRGRSKYDDDEHRSRSHSYGRCVILLVSLFFLLNACVCLIANCVCVPSASPARRSRSRSPKSRRSPSPRRTPSKGENPEIRDLKERSPASKDASPRGRPVDSRSPSPRRSDVDFCSSRANVTESQDDVLAVGAVYTGCTDGRCQFVCWLLSTISYQSILMMIFWLFGPCKGVPGCCGCRKAVRFHMPINVADAVYMKQICWGFHLAVGVYIFIKTGQLSELQP
ncbi:hypothetical protein G4B88_002738 [Cannabis sativa]|uniref:RRM domain-containing protein n=1 Tax=Cannabis sativa TaxID=3483 RepID=A0A7J6HIS0_CANSA|nr:hypothetical protein G4B88_002738 [Cannabis sativa]